MTDVTELSSHLLQVAHLTVNVHQQKPVATESVSTPVYLKIHVLQALCAPQEITKQCAHVLLVLRVTPKYLVTEVRVFFCSKIH